jgi:hypothetical protein
VFSRTRSVIPAGSPNGLSAATPVNDTVLAEAQGRVEVQVGPTTDHFGEGAVTDLRNNHLRDLGREFAHVHGLPSDMLVVSTVHPALP